MFTMIAKNLERLGYKVSIFKTAADAAKYLDSEIDGKTVGFGGSVTLEDMGLYDTLSKHNEVYWHHITKDPAEKEIQRQHAAVAEVYLSSVNGIAETGEIINIDGTGNRVASTIYGHKKVYFVVGKNKMAPDYDSALWRARNIASPMNAKRLNRKTPCAISGHCHNCNSPDRICCSLNVLWFKPLYSEYEVVLIEEDMGY